MTGRLRLPSRQPVPRRLKSSGRRGSASVRCFSYFRVVWLAYSDFTILDLRRRFGVQFLAKPMFPDLVPLELTPWLLATLRRGQELGSGSEKSRSERLVTPMLLEPSDRNHHSFSIYSGLKLDVDPEPDLRGEWDCIFLSSRIQDFVTAPIFCITEAKRQDLEQGPVKCAAQLIAVRRFNELEGNHPQALHGCSTTGMEWRFLKYENNEIIIDKQRYFLTQLPELLGAL